MDTNENKNIIGNDVRDEVFQDKDSINRFGDEDIDLTLEGSVTDEFEVEDVTDLLNEEDRIKKKKIDQKAMTADFKKENRKEEKRKKWRGFWAKQKARFAGRIGSKKTDVSIAEKLDVVLNGFAVVSVTVTVCLSVYYLYKKEWYGVIVGACLIFILMKFADKVNETQ